jgi:MFS family permease
MSAEWDGGTRVRNGMGLNSERSPRALVPVLIFIGTVVAVISSLGAPLIPAIATTMRSSLADAQWALTVTLLVGAVATPVVGRLGDGPRRRTVVLVVLGIVTLGGVLAALPLGLGWLVAGRGLQGFGLGLTPVAIATARETLAGDRSRSTIAALSLTVAAGLGLGYPVAGTIAELAGVHAAFWAGAGFSLVALLASAAVLPRATATRSHRLDGVGAALLGLGLVAVLLVLGEGEAWGWRTAPVVLLAAGGIVVLCGWVAWELRTPFPLVDLRLAGSRQALTAHVAAGLVGLGNYLLIASVPILAQAPRATGAGFGAGIVVAGLILLPFSAASLLGGRLTRVLADRSGRRLILPLAALVQATAFVVFWATRTQLWQLFLVMAIAGLGVGAAFAAFPAQLFAAVPVSETGSAMSLNQVLRYIGFALGSALTATILSAATPARAAAPGSSGYATIAVVGLAVCLLTAGLTWLLPREPSSPDDGIRASRDGAARPTALRPAGR